MRIIFLILIILFNLNAYEIYEDKESNLTIHNILKTEFTNRDSLNFGATKSTIWIKFNIQNSNNYDVDKFLHINMPFLESVNLYEIENIIKESKSGVKVPIEQREMKTHHILFKILIKANSKKDLYISIQSKSAKFIVPTFYEDENEIVSFIGKYNAFIGGSLAILSVLFIYNFFIYLYLRERVYLNYVLYIGATFIHQIFFTGFIANYFYFENYVNMILIFAIFNTIFAIYFIRTLLETKKNLKILDKVLLIYVFFSFLEFIIIYIDPILEIKLRSLSIMIIAILVLTISIASIKAKVKVAKAFLIAWLIYLISLFITGLFITKIIPENFFLSNILQIGLITEIILFSLILAYKVNILKEEKIEAITELRKKDKVLHLQSKFATIGETLCNIEHQWRSPLTKIGSKIGELEVELDYNGVPDEKFLHNFAKESNELINYMSQTVSDFRSFYTPDSKAENFYIKEAVLSSIKLMNFFTEKHQIKINLNMNINPQTYGYKSEFTQVILNIFTNAKDIFIERNIKNPKINILITQNVKNIEIKIFDNGGGIDKNIIDKIFDQFYSQKLEKSTGLGLYMSKVIIEERMKGKIQVKNIKNGAEFIIQINI